MIENQKKIKYGNQRNFLHKSTSSKWFRNGIHSLLSRANARGRADIIYRIRRISLLCRSSI